MNSDTLGTDRAGLEAAFSGVRAAGISLCAPLTTEDFVIQAATEVSPPKWHLAHTTWFFETFVLGELSPGHQPIHPLYRVLFNSYYQTVGEQYPRPNRGVLSRPTVEEIREYRRTVDEQMRELIRTAPESDWPEIARRTTLGIHHEQQHHELCLMDVKYNFSQNPLYPAYRTDLAEPGSTPPLSKQSTRWVRFEGGLREFGATGDAFAFDNERPFHPSYMPDFELSAALITNGEFRAFIEDGGYERPDLWLSDGWSAVEQRGWNAPLYWRQENGAWREFTLGGARPLRDELPVVHVSYYEADAFARWANARLPSEFEWELAARDAEMSGNFLESDLLHPQSSDSREEGATQLFGDVWEWTHSPYQPYAGYRRLPGAFGEYNGKFMCNQFVLRGGSCATPMAHIRATYRNFFYPDQRWAFAGFRIAREA